MMKKLNNSNCNKTLKTQIVMKLKKTGILIELKSQIVIKLKNSNEYETQKI